MKKFLFFLLILLCLTVSAGAEAVSLEEFGVLLAIPEEYNVFYRGMPEDAPVLVERGWSLDDANQMLDDIGAEMVAFGKTSDDALAMNVYSISEYGFPDFTMFGGNAMEYWREIWEAPFDTETDTLTVSEAVYLRGGPFAHYVFSTVWEDGSLHWREQYLTVYNGTVYDLTMLYSAGVSEEMSQSFAEIADSLFFLSPPNKLHPDEEIQPYQITKKEYGLVLQIPENWKDVTPADFDQDKTVWLMSTWDTAADISLDILDFAADDMTPEQQEDWNRQAEMFVENMGETAQSMLLLDPLEILGIQDVQYGDISYRQCSLIREMEVDEMSLLVTETVLLHVRDGVIYRLVYAGVEQDPYYDDFLQIASQMTWTVPEVPAEEAVVPPATEEPEPLVQEELEPEEPEPEEEEPEKSEESESESGEETGPRYTGLLIALIVVIVVLVVGFLLALQWEKKKQKKPTAIRKCPNCGASVDEDQRFCKHCGQAL